MTAAKSKPTVKGIKRTDMATVVRSVRESHDVVVQGIATHAEKHRAEMNAKRDAMKQAALLAAKLPHGTT
jgi:hypothetical protein